MVSPEGHKLSSAINFSFKATNSDSEYEALFNGLHLALEMKVENLNVFSDSSLVVFQVNGGYQSRGPRTELYYKFVSGLIKKFKEVIIEQVPRVDNAGADALAKMGSQREATMLGVIHLKIQMRPSIHEEVVMTLNAPSPTWMTSVWAYVILPNDPKETRRVRYKSARYVIYDDVLYMRGFNTHLLKCIDGDECNYILREVHEGIYGNHSGGSSLAQKILRHGYY